MKLANEFAKRGGGNFYSLARSAFTLAEILITLGIVGVVAALTIPGLMTAYKAHQLRSQFLKSYSTIQQVFRRMEADDISLSKESWVGNQLYKTFMQYLSGAHDCRAGYITGKVPVCYSYKNGNYITLDGKKNITNWYFDDGQILLQDGTLLLFENPSSEYGVNVWVSVDLNGWGKLPNKAGYDLFTFFFKDGELVTMGDKGTTFPADAYCRFDKAGVNNGMECAYRAKTETDYFKNLVKEFK